MSSIFLKNWNSARLALFTRRYTGDVAPGVPTERGEITSLARFYPPNAPMEHENLQVIFAPTFLLHTNNRRGEKFPPFLTLSLQCILFYRNNWRVEKMPEKFLCRKYN